MGGIVSSITGMFNGANGTDFAAQGLSADSAHATQNDANATINQQQQFLQQLAAQQGVTNQSNVFQQQQQLANQLQLQAAGGGPNPALAQLQNTTGQNVSNQAALAAGQRGAGANAGLIARQVGQQGAATQQQAVGQGAAMAAQQQLNAQGALQSQQANLANLATQQVGQQTNQLQGIQSAQGNLLNSEVNSQNNENSANAGIANTNAQFQQGVVGGVANAVGGALHLASGGPVTAVQTPDAPKSKIGQLLAGSPTAGNILPATQSAGMQSGFNVGQDVSKAIGSGINALLTPAVPVNAGMGDASAALTGTPQVANKMTAGVFAKGGRVPALVSPGETYIPPDKVKAAASSSDPRKMGKTIPGKAAVKGDSTKNDTVPTTLETGGIVLPRSVTQAADPAKAAHSFVTAVMAKSKLRKK